MDKKLVLTSILAGVIIVGAGCRNKPPKTPIKPIGPNVARQGDTAAYLSVTVDPNLDKLLYIWDWGDGTFDTTNLKPSGDTTIGRHCWASIGIYTIRVRAKDAKGKLSVDWSDTLNVRVIALEQLPPVVGAPIGPDSGWVGEWQVFKAVAEDPNNDSVKIKFLWDENQTSAVSALVASGDTVIDSVRYQHRGIKNIRCVAWDKTGLISDTSPAKQFLSLQENHAPYQPVVWGPKRGIAQGPYYRFYSSSVDPEGDKIQYKFFWGDGTSSQWTPLNPSGYKGIDSIIFTQTGTYYIRAIAQDSLGLTSDTSAVFAFEVANEGTILWQTNIDEFISSPALGTVNTGGENRPALIIGCTDNRLFAFDLYQAETLYIQLGDGTWEGFFSSPAINADGTVYIGNENGRVFAFAPTGAFKWGFPETLSQNAFYSSPAVDGNYIYVAGEEGKIYKLQDNGNSYTELWGYQLADEVASSPVILSDGRVVVVNDSGYVTCLTSDGTLSWQYFANSGVTSSPAVDNYNNIYFGTEQGDLITLDQNGTLMWAHHVPSLQNDILSSPVIDQNGNIYFGCNDGYLYKLSPSGNLEWRYEVQTNAALTSTPALTQDGVLYIFSPADSLTEKLCAINTADGTLRWEVMLYGPAYRSGGLKPHPRRFSIDILPSPVIDRYGIIYIAGENGGVYAIAGRPEGVLLQSHWPMFRHDHRHTGKFGENLRR